MKKRLKSWNKPEMWENLQDFNAVLLGTSPVNDLSYVKTKNFRYLYLLISKTIISFSVFRL